MVQLEQAVQQTLKERLKDVFGFSQFRGAQEDIIHNVLASRNTFVIMPTGAGKSLCYQLPAITSAGMAIVISPLIALMKNQVDQLTAFGINAQFLNSTLNKAEINRVKKDALNGTLKLLYIAPESLTKEDNLDFLQRANVSFVAIDEAHCISEWGHDFRPEYRRIRGIIDNINAELPIIALTATATPKVQQDIIKNLRLEEAELFKTSFNRKNLYYEVRPKIGDVNKQLIKYIKNNKGKSGIVYCLSRKTVEEVAQLLVVNDIKALPYHAGLDPHTRMNNQDAFLNEEADVICATIAFGMGIDKPDVRFVIHYDAPKSLEGYYQETGRSGRDGLEGNCVMFYSIDDIMKLEKFNKDKPVTERDNAKHLLHEMVAYANLGACRRRQLLSYFGEHMEKDCGFCDNCLKPTPKFKVQEEAVIILKAVQQTDERFDGDHIADLVTATDNIYVTSYEHNKLDTYGAGKAFQEEVNVDYWRSLVRQLVIYGYLGKDPENFGVLTLSEKGQAYINDPYPITMSKEHTFDENENKNEDEDRDNNAANGGVAYDEALLGLLKALRKKLAKEKNLPPYVIFQDPSLEEMATTYPTTAQEMAQINGVGMGKVQKFGKPFVDTITKYVEENDIETAQDVVVKSTANKSKVKIFIIQQIDRKVDLDEIAESKGLAMEEIIEEIEHICFSGTKLNLDYYINQIMDRDRQSDIYDYFMAAETDSIQDAMDEFAADDMSENEIRLMRIKFLSEVAN
ncbi:MAG: DNA helicase RecQ [Runella slithyformis]|nr:MAG: DNA helicase RecQ [Runella slithyformis]TAE99211.1 MAG: DNA helicase RecQ [Runella slithyformis]TAF24392.1 MAG: DNA helicase RecQ [Runella slithyformis]TAF49325.1 MAG: DNA helicase RecQ [Runella slithyformis]TAF79185.1 MAG: DNA helicase RecQ [Runella slithyformis]